MYNRNQETTTLVALVIYEKQVSKLSRILKRYPEGEKRIIAIGKFLNDLPNNDEAFNKDILVKNCRAYASFSMNETCFAQEVLSEEIKIKRKKEKIKEEQDELKKILKEADKLTSTQKNIDENRRKALSEIVRKNKFEVLHLTFQEIEKIIEMTCTTEITLSEANSELQIVSNHLAILGEYLKK